MRLIEVSSMKLVEFWDDDQVPAYGILSHRWGAEEVTLQDFQKRLMKLTHPGYEKIKKFCQKVSGLGLEYAWIDTCCIDKTSSAELSESINSMFNWYRRATMCFVYLADVLIADLALTSHENDALPPRANSQYQEMKPIIADRLSRSAWFTRGWTLQELLAPAKANFYDSNWSCFGDKTNLEDILSTKTGIETQFLSGFEIEAASVAKRMSWASKRKTTRVEDMAYCLLGIFGVNMPLLYGEGVRAFTRLQEEIMKESSDQSLFAWTVSKSSARNALVGPLATSPADFADAGNITPYPDFVGDSPYSITNQGLRIDIPLYPYPRQPGLWLAILSCYDNHVEHPLAILVQLANTRATNGTRSIQYGRFSMPREPIIVTTETLGAASIETIYMKKIPTTRTHDKEYSIRLRVADLRLEQLMFKSAHAHSTSYTYLTSYPKSDVLKNHIVNGEGYTVLASNDNRIGISFSLYGSIYLICLSLESPETYVHELDRWLRTACRTRLVHPNLPLTEDEVKGHMDQLHTGWDPAMVQTTTSPIRTFATAVRKDFENGGKVIDIECRYVDYYEHENGERFPAGERFPVELSAERSPPLSLDEDGQEVERALSRLKATEQARVDAYAVLNELRSHCRLPDRWFEDAVITDLTIIDEGSAKAELNPSLPRVSEISPWPSPSTPPVDHEYFGLEGTETERRKRIL